MTRGLATNPPTPDRCQSRSQHVQRRHHLLNLSQRHQSHRQNSQSHLNHSKLPKLPQEWLHQLVAGQVSRQCFGGHRLCEPTMGHQHLDRCQRQGCHHGTKPPAKQPITSQPSNPSCHKRATPAGAGTQCFGGHRLCQLSQRDFCNGQEQRTSGDHCGVRELPQIHQHLDRCQSRSQHVQRRHHLLNLSQRHQSHRQNSQSHLNHSKLPKLPEGATPRWLPAKFHAMFRWSPAVPAVQRDSRARTARLVTTRCESCRRPQPGLAPRSITALSTPPPFARPVTTAPKLRQNRQPLSTQQLHDLPKVSQLVAATVSQHVSVVTGCAAPQRISARARTAPSGDHRICEVATVDHNLAAPRSITARSTSPPFARPVTTAPKLPAKPPTTSRLQQTARPATRVVTPAGCQPSFTAMCQWSPAVPAVTTGFLQRARTARIW